MSILYLISGLSVGLRLSIYLICSGSRATISLPRAPLVVCGMITPSYPAYLKADEKLLVLEVVGCIKPPESDKISGDILKCSARDSLLLKSPRFSGFLMLR